MKAINFFILLTGISLQIFGQQEPYELMGTVTKKINPLSGKSIDVGQKINILRFEIDPVLKDSYIAISGGSQELLSPGDIKKIQFDDPTSINKVWKIIRINSDLDQSLFSRGLQYDLRKDLEDEALDLLENLDKYYGFFNDEFLDDYIQGILYQIHPITLADNRPGNLVVKVVQINEPNAFCTPNGIIIITTGLLSTIRSEDELIGILAHEVAHFVLDHQILNINKATQRQKRAEFWAGITTGIAAASELYLSAKYDIYPTGNLTLATAIISTSIANSIIARMGANYSIDQEWEADNASSNILKYLGKNPLAFATALSRIKTYCILTGNYSALGSSGTHPNLNARIAKIGSPDQNSFKSLKYDQMISFVNTFNAFNEFRIKHLETVIELVDRNIEADVAIEDDLLIKAMSIRILYNTPEKNQESLELINKAKTLNIVPRNYLYKQEGITLIRLGKITEAQSAFKNYLQVLETLTNRDTFLETEIEWTKKMVNKLNAIKTNIY